MNVMTSAEAEDIICSDPVLMRTVSDAIRETGTAHKYRDTARRCAAYLSCDDWFEIRDFVIGDPGGWVSQEELLNHEADMAFEHCKEAGLIPTGFWAPLLYWGLRQAVWAFLKWLVRSRLMKGQEG